MRRNQTNRRLRQHIHVGKEGKLEAIGIRPSKVRKLKTIEGKTIEREVGEATIECMGEKATSIVVFAEKDDVEVMGVVTLESLALEVDPVTKQLRKAETLLALTATTDQ